MSMINVVGLALGVAVSNILIYRFPWRRDWSLIADVGIAMIIGVAVVIAMFTWVLLLVVALITIGIAAWACGVKFTVKKNNEPVGYVRWLKLYDTQGKEIPWGSL